MNYSETESTEIKNYSETEGTGLNFNALKAVLILLTLMISNSAFSSEIYLFESNSTGNVKGIYIDNGYSFFISGQLENNILSAQIMEDTIKSTDEGTGDADEEEATKSTDEGTGDTGNSEEDSNTKSTDEGTGDTQDSTDEGTGGNKSSYSEMTISVILQCNQSEGIIENSKGKVIDLFKGRVHLNGKAINCNNRNIELNNF